MNSQEDEPVCKPNNHVIDALINCVSQYGFKFEKHQDFDFLMDLASFSQILRSIKHKTKSCYGALCQHFADNSSRNTQGNHGICIGKLTNTMDCPKQVE